MLPQMKALGTALPMAASSASANATFFAKSRAEGSSVSGMSKHLVLVFNRIAIELSS
jgi:hypothetical protein